MKRILAVAVGPEKTNRLIRTMNDLGSVRPYVRGLIATLAKRRLGVDYDIDYREVGHRDLENPKTAAEALKPRPGEDNHLVFAMSTTALRAALRLADSPPIVFPSVSDHKADGIKLAGRATGVSARRSQTAGQCFEYFLATVPTLKVVRCLHKPGYPPGERALKLVQAAAEKRNVTVRPMAVKSHQDIEKALARLPTRKVETPASMGILVLPVDLCLSAAAMIIDQAQTKRNHPTFFPVTDWVRPALPSALGGYGVPQQTCGELTAEYVDLIVWNNSRAGALEVKQAPKEAFKWVVSRAAAKALNITVPDLI